MPPNPLRKTRLPNVELEQEIAESNLIRRLDSIEAQQRGIAQGMAAQTQKFAQLVHQIVKIDTTVGRLSDGLKSNVLHPIELLKKAANEEFEKTQIQARVLKSHDEAVRELQKIAHEVRTAVLELAANGVQVPTRTSEHMATHGTAAPCV